MHTLYCARGAGAEVALCSEPQHNACMPTAITIRDVPDETRDELAARAAATGRSLQEYLRAQLIELGSRPDPLAWLARVRERKQETEARVTAQEIIGHRDADRR